MDDRIVHDRCFGRIAGDVIWTPIRRAGRGSDAEGDPGAVLLGPGSGAVHTQAFVVGVDAGRDQLGH